MSVILIAPACPVCLKQNVRFFKADLNDHGAVLALVEQLRQQYRCVLSMPWTDPPVELNAKVAQCLGTPGPALPAATKARNKYEMVKAVAARHPQYVPDFKLVGEHEEFEEMQFPCILKPISASGSKGIYLARDAEQAKSSLAELLALASAGPDRLSYSRYGRDFLCESYITGQEFSVEGVVVNHECFIAGVTEKTVQVPWFLEQQHVFPAQWRGEVLEAIHHAAAEIVEALGLNNAAFHLEAKWSESGFKLIEIAARIGGDLISTHLVGLSRDCHWVREVIRALIDQQLPQLPPPVRHAGIRFQIAEKAGQFRRCIHPEQTPPWASPQPLHAARIAEVGGCIRLPPEDFSSCRLAYVLGAAASRPELDKLLEWADAHTIIDIV